MIANSRATDRTAVFFPAIGAVFSRIPNFEFSSTFLASSDPPDPFFPYCFFATVRFSVAFLAKCLPIVWVVASIFVVAVCLYVMNIQNDFLALTSFCATTLACVIISLQDGIYECLILLGFVSGLPFFGATSPPHRVVFSDEMRVSWRYVASTLDAFAYCGSVLYRKFTTREGIRNLFACFVGQFSPKASFIAHSRLRYFYSHMILFGGVVDFVATFGPTRVRAKLGTSTSVVFPALFTDSFIILRHNARIAKGRVGCNPK
jgi:hypothetical protein